MDAIHHPVDFLKVLLLLSTLVEDLQHQGFEMLVDPPPHEPLTLVPLQPEEVVESLGVDQMLEDQRHQAVAVEDPAVHTQTDGDRAAAYFVGVEVIGVEVGGQDAIEGIRAQRAVVVGEVVLTHHLEVAVEVDAVHAAVDRHPRLVVFPVERAGDGLVLGDGGHVDEGVVGLGLLVAEEAEFLVVVDRHDEGLGGEVVHHLFSFLLELLQHLLLFLRPLQLHLSHRLGTGPTGDRCFFNGFLFILQR